MLVLSRKNQEAIKIGKDIEITIIAIEGEQVKIGIDAPKNIEIHRKELVQAIEEQNSEAANISVSLSSLLKEKK
ncbi:MAG TPA: carbon storage regulator CsrA [Pseudogracilibacillus sp.]|nr:carbon storage regulator CsrA [Pseudogracilibacillus sp.]